MGLGVHLSGEQAFGNKEARIPWPCLRTLHHLHAHIRSPPPACARWRTLLGPDQQARAAHGVGAPTCTGSGAVEGSKAIGRANTRCAGCCRRLLVEVPPYAGEPLPLYEPAYELMVPYAVAGKRAVGAGGD